jgi:hypothetical protein
LVESLPVSTKVIKPLPLTIEVTSTSIHWKAETLPELACTPPKPGALL